MTSPDSQGRPTAQLSAPLPPGLSDLAAAVGTRLTAALTDGSSRIGIAYSGGVDSGLLLALAVRTLGPERVLAIIGVSPSLAADERHAAHDVAAVIGVPVVEVATHEGEVAAYRANGPDRCFHCKDELFTRISDEVAEVHGLEAVAYGENADDAKRPDRPGARAATNHSILRPLADADPTKLRQIEALEHDLHALGFTDCRVRHHGEIARIELLEGDLERAMTPELRSLIAEAGRAADFTFVAVDVSGIQSGAFTLPLVRLTHG